MQLLLVEDDPAMRSILKTALDRHGHPTTACATAVAAREALSAQAYDSIILDLELPDGSGLAILEEIRKRADRVDVIIITGGRTALEDRVRGLNAGADDYLVKPFAFPELLARLHAVHRRSESAASPVLRTADLAVDLAARTVRRGERAIELTAREFDLLVHLMRNVGAVVTREQLAKEVWRVNRRMTSMDNLIDVHISHLRRKIDLPSEAPLLQTVRGAGFMIRA